MLNSKGVLGNFGGTPADDFKRLRQELTNEANERLAFNPNKTPIKYEPAGHGPGGLRVPLNKFRPGKTNQPMYIRGAEYNDQSIFNMNPHVQNKMTTDFENRNKLKLQQDAAKAAQTPGRRIKDFFGNLGNKVSNAGQSAKNFLSNLVQRLRPANYRKKAYGLRRRGRKGGRVTRKYKKRRLIK